MPPPGISLVIPLRNEADSLPELWRTIQARSTPPDETVLIDGGSTDRTVALATRLAAADPRVRLVEAGDATPGRGRNIGIAAASHDWLALTDGGIVLEPSWLEELVLARDRDPATQVVYGHYEPLISSFFVRCAALAYVGLLNDTPAGNLRGPTVASMLLHRSAWTAAGGFPDRRATEDLVFISALDSPGLGIAWAPAAIVWWEPRRSLVATFRRFSLCSTMAVQTGRHRDWHHQIVKKYLFAVPFVALASTRHWAWGVVPAAGGAARVTASIWRRRETRGLQWLLNPFQFLGVAVVILTIDAATFLGWARALLIKARVPSTGAVDQARIP